VKELVICGMLLASRDIVGGIAWAQGLKGGEDVPKAVEKGKGQFGGTEIFKKTLGVLGLGAIGALVANAAAALGMSVLGYDPFLTEATGARLNPDIQIATLDEIYSKSDFISLQLPYTAATKGIINDEVFAKMKTGAVLINASRAELVDGPAVLKALADKKLAKYVVDFPTDEVLGVPGVIAIPHLGASTEEAEENCAYMAAAQVKDYLENGNVTNSVNFPTLKVPRKAGASRLTVAYRGTEALAAVQKCAGAFEQAAKGELGYIIIDTEAPAGALAAELQKLDGVLKVRVV
jgi:D-3-phosphoglycerate dehydrogenase